MKPQDSEKVSNNFIIKMTESGISLHAAIFCAISNCEDAVLLSFNLMFPYLELGIFEVAWNYQYLISCDKWGVKIIVIKFPSLCFFHIWTMSNSFNTTYV